MVACNLGGGWAHVRAGLTVLGLSSRSPGAAAPGDTPSPRGGGPPDSLTDYGIEVCVMYDIDMTGLTSNGRLEALEVLCYDKITELVGQQRYDEAEQVVALMKRLGLV